MPLVWEDNPLFLEHEGPHGTVSVYHVYKDDSFGGGVRAFWYGLTPYASDDGGENGEFDVRDLKAAAGIDFGFMGDEAAIHATIIRAIESGELRWPEEDQEEETDEHDD